MTGALFRPFSLKKWFVVGFTAWLAGLGSGGGGYGSNSFGNLGDSDASSGGVGEVWQTILASGLLLGLVAAGCLALLVVVIAVAWVSSRGKFMFLDNVVYNRALVVDPWHRFKKQGNSLFFFYLAFGLSCVLLIGSLILVVAGTVGLSAWSDFATGASIALVVAGVCTLGLLVLVISYAAFFTDAFVVPLMHRYALGAVDGWRRFLGIFREHVLGFLFCGLVVIAGGLGALLLIVVFGVMTCCLGFLLLMIPYLNNVMLLPILMFYRSFTLEFLAQFDADLLPQESPRDSPPESPLLPPPPVEVSA